MLDLLFQYGLFLAKTVTVVVALMIIIIAIANAGGRRRTQEEGDIEVLPLNERLEDYADTLRLAMLDKAGLKAWRKAEKKARKQEEGKTKDASRPRLYVINFHGDIRASAVEMLRREITAILTLAEPARDEIVVCLESPGGMVHGYGLAASQLARIRQKNIPLTICVDKVAASGGYMMACIGNRILAAPFAVVGSIGVVAQMPNFHRLLKKNDIDVELMTAGEYKRTLTIFGQNTEADRAKFQEELDDTHALFKEFVQQNRPQVDIARVATGEHWYGQRALDLQLVDELKTSDEYLCERAKEGDLYSVRYVPRHRFLSRLGLSAEAAADRFALRWWDRLQQRPWW
ncbi:MAG: putative protease SohB [Moraxellaceae bacterium]|nr:putative protease SohB [Moraxellaceae bacterium]